LKSGLFGSKRNIFTIFQPAFADFNQVFRSVLKPALQGQIITAKRQRLWLKSRCSGKKRPERANQQVGCPFRAQDSLAASFPGRCHRAKMGWAFSPGYLVLRELFLHSYSPLSQVSFKCSDQF
jgi:hypothetical protein